MSEKINPKTKPFAITRTFEAGKDVLWKMWTEAEHLKNWWALKDTIIKYKKIELEPGGMNHYCMIHTLGDELWGRQIYREVKKPNSLVFINSFSDSTGKICIHPFSPTWPKELLTTVLFYEHLGKTTVTLEWIPFDASDAETETFEKGRTSMSEGWNGSFDGLEKYLATLK